MKFFLDHDVPDVAGRVLTAAGHEVTLLREVAASNIQDSDVLTLASERGEVLITCNRDDFLKLAREREHGGIIVLIRRRTRTLENAKLLALLDAAGEMGIAGNVNYA